MVRILSLLTADLHAPFFRGVPGAERFERASPQDLQAALRRTAAHIVVFDPLCVRAETAMEIARFVRGAGARPVLVGEPTLAAASRMVALALRGEVECALIGECPPESLIQLLALGCDASAAAHVLHSIAPRVSNLAKQHDKLAVIRLMSATHAVDTPEAPSQRRRFRHVGLRSGSVIARAARVCTAHDRCRLRPQSTQWSLAEAAQFGGERAMYDAFVTLSGLPPQRALRMAPQALAAQIAGALTRRPPRFQSG